MRQACYLLTVKQVLQTLHCSVVYGALKVQKVQSLLFLKGLSAW